MAKSCTQGFSGYVEQWKISILSVALNAYTYTQVALTSANCDGRSTNKRGTLLTQRLSEAASNTPYTSQESNAVSRVTRPISHSGDKAPEPKTRRDACCHYVKLYSPRRCLLSYLQRWHLEDTWRTVYLNEANKPLCQMKETFPCQGGVSGITMW